MKGKELTIVEIIKLPHGTKVWNEDEYYNGICYINQEEEFISYNDDITRGGWYFDKLLEYKRDYKIYEWIEENTKQPKELEAPEPKTYRASEIIAMIEDGKLIDEDTIINKDEEKVDISSIKTWGISLYDAPFTIKERLTPVDFNTAVNSGKKIKPLSLKDEKSYHPYTYWLGYLVSGMAHGKQPLDYINGQWLIENKYN